MASKKDAPWNGPKKDEPAVESWRADSIVGWFFYTWKDNNPSTGQIQFQGCISGSQGGGYFVVEYFEWFMGEPTHCEIVNLQEIEECKWVLFRSQDDREWWHDRYKKQQAKKKPTAEEPQA